MGSPDAYLLSEFQKHSEILRCNDESLRIAAKNAKTPFFKVCGIPKTWSCCHHATLTGAEAFLSQMIGVYQASWTVDNPKLWQAPGMDDWKRCSTAVKRVLDRWVSDWELRDIGSGLPSFEQILKAERENWRYQSSVPSEPMPKDSQSDGVCAPTKEKITIERFFSRSEFPGFQDAVTQLMKLPHEQRDLTAVSKEVGAREKCNSATLRGYLSETRSLWETDLRAEK